MARSFEVDVSRFLQALEGAAETISDGAIRGTHDALDEWKADAVDIAPLDKGTLRRSIVADHTVKSDGDAKYVEITANATENRNGRRFNYAYYIHEKDAGGKSLRTPGTEKKFLDVALQRKESKWMADIEHEIEAELKRKGW